MKKVLSVTFVIFLLSLIGSVSVHALEISDTDCTVKSRYIPNACKEAYIPGIQAGYTADLNCANAKILNPKNTCCPNMCVDADGVAGKDSEKVPSEIRQFEVFNTTFRVSTESIPTLINLSISTVLGVFSLYTLIRGMFVAGYKRSQATSADDIANINKDLTNMVIGFALAWGFIILIQITASALGVGQLSNMDLTSSSTGTVITIK